MASTYTPIATTTLGSAASSVTFSSIPSTYTDLVLVFNGSNLGSAGQDIVVNFNGDTGTNYSRTYLLGNGTAASSGRSSNAASWAPGGLYPNSFYTIHFMNYSNTTTYKTMIARDSVPDAYPALTVGLWRSTSAINSITALVQGANFSTGSTFTLYGIASA